jgi:hypothetical protein
MLIHGNIQGKRHRAGDSLAPRLISSKLRPNVNPNTRFIQPAQAWKPMEECRNQRQTWHDDTGPARIVTGEPEDGQAVSGPPRRHSPNGARRPKNIRRGYPAITMASQILGKLRRKRLVIAPACLLLHECHAPANCCKAPAEMHAYGNCLQS